MQKVAGIDSVRVRLNDGLTILDLRADNTVTLEQLRTVLKDNGFVAKEVHAVARGTVEQRNGQPVLAVSGTRESFVLSAGRDNKNALDEALRRGSASAVEVTGTIDASGARPAAMRVQTVR